jgi:hypothetical protein
MQSVVEIVSVSCSRFYKKSSQPNFNHIILRELQEGLLGGAPGPEPDFTCYGNLLKLLVLN